MTYLIQVPLVGGGWYDLCRCDHAAHVAAVITALLSASSPPTLIQVVVLFP